MLPPRTSRAGERADASPRSRPPRTRPEGSVERYSSRLLVARSDRGQEPAGPILHDVPIVLAAHVGLPRGPERGAQPGVVGEHPQRGRELGIAPVEEPASAAYALALEDAK